MKQQICYKRHLNIGNQVTIQVELLKINVLKLLKLINVILDQNLIISGTNQSNSLATQPTNPGCTTHTTPPRKRFTASLRLQSRRNLLLNDSSLKWNDPFLLSIESLTIHKHPYSDSHGILTSFLLLFTIILRLLTMRLSSCPSYALEPISPALCNHVYLNAVTLASFYPYSLPCLYNPRSHTHVKIL